MKTDRILLKFWRNFEEILRIVILISNIATEILENKI